MRTIIAVLICACALVIAGCETRSISDSDYRRGWGREGNPLYKGELTEHDVLGVAPKQDASEDAIQKALNAGGQIKLKRGDSVLLIQSGAMLPDAGMIDAARAYFEIAPFSGIPGTGQDGMAESLRLRAAQGGYPYVLCYWGVLETSRENREGAAVSWVPIVGGFIPDQKQQMRIRLKGLLVDVRSGAWRMYTPEVYSDSKWTSGLAREKADQALVDHLKTAGYRALVTELLK